MKKDWQDLFSTEVPREYKNNVLKQADAELKLLKGDALPWFYRWQFHTAMASVFALFIYFKNASAPKDDEVDFLATNDDQLFEDIDLFEDYELIEALNEDTGDFDI